jgi:cold shock CspA family protein
LAVSPKPGRLIILRVEDITRVLKNEAEISEQQPVAVEPAADAQQEVRHDDVYEIEQPPLNNLKIVGKVNLDEIEPHRRERIRKTPIRQQPREEYPLEDNQPEDNGVKVPALGVISAIGPKFGFIESDNQETLYFNIGEVMKGWHSELSLEKGDKVVYSRSENARGIVAKCVHHPWSVDRHLQIIENLAYRDMRNAKLLAGQLNDAFPNDDSIRDELYNLRML